VRELQDYGVQVDVRDPQADANEARHEYGLDLVQTPQDAGHDAIILAVAHNRFKGMGACVMRSFGRANHVLYDLKNVLSTEESD